MFLSAWKRQPNPANGNPYLNVELTRMAELKTFPATGK